MLAVLDIGGTNLRVGIARGFDRIDNSVIVPTSQSYEEGIATIFHEIENLRQGESISHVVIGIAGPLNDGHTMLVGSPRLSQWVGKPLVKDVSEKLSADVFLQNDAAIGALGEAVYGAGKDYDIVAYIAIGTGLGGARIVKGKLDDSAFGFEPGHQVIVIDGKGDACGPKGHLEAYVSGRAIAMQQGKPPEDIADPKVWSDIAKLLAVGLTNTIVHWSPHVVVLAGPVSQHIPLDEVSEHVNSLLIFPKRPQLVLGVLGEQTGLYGGLAYLQSQIKR